MRRIAVVVTLLFVTCVSCSRGTSHHNEESKPNVLFVLTDDMRLDDMQYMPKVRSLIGDEGATFDNYFDNVTLCCPARASILRGQYAHNTGVLSNGSANGGFATAHARKIEDSTIATAMHDAGYTTGLFGKYLNGYPATAGPSFVPPGWDHWASGTKGDVYGEYDYTLNENGKQVEYGHKPDDYGTTVYTRLTSEFIDQAVSQSKPFFAYLTVYAPHGPATPAPRDADAFPGLQSPRDPAYDEADVSDKPQFIQRFDRITPGNSAALDERYRKRVQSLQAVDRAVGALIEQLRANNQLDNTYVFFASDNGFHLGQHRMPAGKQTAYETDIHLPLLVRGPGVKPGSHIPEITGNVDLAQTFVALGGGAMTDDPDGRSLAPLLTGQKGADWRQAFLVEHWRQLAGGPDTAGTPLEPNDLDEAQVAPASTRPGTDIPDFVGLRLPTYTYVEYATGERELYDLTKDPDELDNIAASANPQLLALLHDRLDQMRLCVGDACRQAESVPLDLPN